MKYYVKNGVVYFDSSIPVQLVDIVKVLSSDCKLIPCLYSFKIYHERFNVTNFQKFLNLVRTLALKTTSFNNTFEDALMQTADSFKDFCKKFELTHNHSKSGSTSDDEDISPEVDDSFEYFKEEDSSSSSAEEPLKQNSERSRYKYKTRVGERSL